MNRISQPADGPSMDGPAQIDACREDLSFKFESSFDISSGVFSPATSDSPQAIFAPLHYEPRYAYPLLVWLHGPGNDHQQLLRIMPLVSLRNYLAVAPQGILTKPQEEYRWDQTTSHIDLAQQRIFDCIETVSRKYNFSRRKIFLAGFDFGGTMALRVAMNSPKRFAGVISLGGAFPMGRKPFGNLNDARHLPIFLAAGRKSKSYSEAHVCSDLRLLHSAGIQVTLRQYPCGQEIAPHMLQDMDRWIIEQITAPAQSLAETDEYK